jgi:hypothetical protein
LQIVDGYRVTGSDMNTVMGYQKADPQNRRCSLRSGSITGNTLTITGTGTVVVAANQAGNANYAAAPQVTQSVIVNQGTPIPQTITFTAPPSPVTYGVSPITLSATGGAFHENNAQQTNKLALTLLCSGPGGRRFQNPLSPTNLFLPPFQELAAFRIAR